jgi:hypothetical protein
MSAVDWGNLRETIIVWRVHSNWNARDSDKAWHDISTLAQSDPDTSVCLLIDTRQSFLPINFAQKLRTQVENYTPPNLKMCTIITLDSLYFIFHRIFVKQEVVSACQFNVVDNVDQAYLLAQAFEESEEDED